MKKRVRIEFGVDVGDEYSLWIPLDGYAELNVRFAFGDRDVFQFRFEFRRALHTHSCIVLDFAVFIDKLGAVTRRIGANRSRYDHNVCIAITLEAIASLFVADLFAFLRPLDFRFWECVHSHRHNDLLFLAMNVLAFQSLDDARWRGDGQIPEFGRLIDFVAGDNCVRARIAQFRSLEFDGVNDARIRLFAACDYDTFAFDQLLAVAQYFDGWRWIAGHFDVHYQTIARLTREIVQFLQNGSTFDLQIDDAVIFAQIVHRCDRIEARIFRLHAFDDQRHALGVFIQKFVFASGFDDLALMFPFDFRGRVSGVLQFNHGRATDAGVRLFVFDRQCWLFRFAEQFLNGSLHRQLCAARNVAGGGLGDARINAGIFRFHMLEHQRQRILVFAQQDLEPFLRIEFLAVAFPFEHGLLASWQYFAEIRSEQIFVGAHGDRCLATGDAIFICGRARVLARIGVFHFRDNQLVEAKIIFFAIHLNVAAAVARLNQFAIFETENEQIVKMWFGNRLGNVLGVAYNSIFGRGSPMTLTMNRKNVCSMISVSLRRTAKYGVFCSA